MERILNLAFFFFFQSLSILLSLHKACFVFRVSVCVQVNLFPYLGRVRGIKSVLRDLNFQSKQMGRRENKTINMEGRVQFDLLQVSSSRTDAVHPLWKDHFLWKKTFGSVKNFFPSLPGAPQRLQTALVYSQRRELPLLARTERGRAALHHHRFAGNRSSLCVCCSVKNCRHVCIVKQHPLYRVRSLFSPTARRTGTSRRAAVWPSTA